MVEEDQYRSTYKRLNERRCVFEKAILSRRCNCSCSTRFYLADREGIACDSDTAHDRCARLIPLLRQNSKFVLKLTHLDGELPHGKEIKLQNGGMLGLQRVLRPDLTTNSIVDIAGLTKLGEHTYGALEVFPFREIVKSIARFESRRKPRPKG